MSDEKREAIYVEKKQDLGRPSSVHVEKFDFATKGKADWYHVGLTEEAPYNVITVPTVILPGRIRGKCVEVPKRTGSVQMGPNNILIHNEGAKTGRFERLFKVEYEAFLNYCRTHVFRRTGTYTSPDPETKQKVEHWRAEIENLDPNLAGGIRSLHDEDVTTGERLSQYVWIAPARLDVKGKPIDGGPQDVIAKLDVAQEAKAGAAAKK